ncbi:MAG: glycosyltransferase family 4 protein [Actinomycetota bacterium]
MSSKTSPKVLVLSRTYPNRITPILGLWVEGLVRHVSQLCDIKVIAPTPYCPPVPGMREFTKYRSIEKKRNEQGVDIFHPRYLTGPGYSTYNFEGSSYYWSIRQQVDQLREEFPFDVIHANFGYPDGVVAAKLAARYNVPFIITEHASWIPWMDKYPQVRRQAVWAASQSAFHIAVSSFARQTIAHFTGDTKKLCVIPNGVDVNVFTPLKNGERMNPNQILYVGLTRHVKGIDVLLQAMSQVVKEKPELKLVIVGGGINRNYTAQEMELREMAKKLGLTENVEFAGLKTPPEVARYMRESALLVLPSRIETFGAVLIEALACGTPVVATKCGGPEDVVNNQVGQLVPTEDVTALANAIVEVIGERGKFNSQKLREYAVKNFAWEEIARQTVGLYNQAVNNGTN